MVSSAEYAASEYITSDCTVMHAKGENIFLFIKVQKHKIQDGGMFTRKFKMAAVFVKLYSSLPIYRCKDLSNPSRIDRDRFFKDICNSRGECAPPQI